MNQQQTIVPVVLPTTSTGITRNQNSIPTSNKPIAKSTTTCGVIKTNMQVSNRIAFGSINKEGSAPWHVAIFKRHNYTCGGSLIHTNMILTAGHCLVDEGELVNESDLIIKLGLYQLYEDYNYTQTYDVAEVILHINYNPDTYEHDIGLFKLQRHVQMTDFVTMVCLPVKNFNFVNRIGEIVGWGENENAEIQDTMQKAYIAVVDRQECLESNRDHFGKRLYRTNFCAGNRNRKKFKYYSFITIFRFVLFI